MNTRLETRPRESSARPKSSAREVEVDVTRRYTVRKRTILEHIWILPEGVGDRNDARAMAEDEGEANSHYLNTVAEHWLVERESKSDVVRRLVLEGYTATEIANLTGWDYSFVYGVTWRDSGGHI